MGGGENKPVEGQTGEQASSGGGFMDKFNSMAGGGKESEKKEDYLDKGLFLLTREHWSLSTHPFSRHRLGAGESDGPRPARQRVRF